MTIDELVEHIKTELMKKEGNAEREKTMVRLIHALHPIMILRPHHSDCAVHNAPAEPPGPCDCGALIEARK